MVCAWGSQWQIAFLVAAKILPGILLSGLNLMQFSLLRVEYIYYPAMQCSVICPAVTHTIWRNVAKKRT